MEWLAVRYCRLFVRIWAWVAFVETVAFVVLGSGDDYVHFVRQMRLFAAHPFAPHKFSKKDRESLFKAYNLRGPAAEGEGFKFRMVYNLLDHVQLGSAGAADGHAGLVGWKKDADEELWGALILSEDDAGDDSDSVSSLTSDELNSDTFAVARGRFGVAGGGRGIQRWWPKMPTLVRWVLPMRWTRKIEKITGELIWNLRLWHMCVGQLPVTSVLVKGAEDWWWIHVMPRLLSVPHLGSWLARFAGVRVSKGELP